MRAAGILAFVTLLGWLPVRGAEAPMAEIVVAMRYPQQTGVSHAHLYLYRADGKLLRQLTRDDGGQDSNPVFAPDGETIVFMRDAPGGGKQCWSIEPRGSGLRQMTAPDWYTQAKPSPYFDYEPEAESVQTPAAPSPPDGPAGLPRSYRTADGSAEIVLADARKDDGEDQPQGHDFLLRDLKIGRETRLGTMPGFEALERLLMVQTDGDKQFFLEEGKWRLAFFATHFNSTDGSTVHVLDLAERRFVRLSPNWASPVPLPGEAAFLTLTENRYVPFGDGKHTANCSYIERWDSTLKHVRYAEGKIPGICYGASMYRPAQTPATITIHQDSE